MSRTDAAPPSAHKIRPRHHDRLAVVYVRQSTPQQVVCNRESTDLQYQLRQRAVALGWGEDRVLVIDDDQGVSGASVDNRPGFRRLLAEVSLGHVGIVFGREMSRLSRSCKDWYQLLELCGLFQVLLADADGVYDPTDPNDRMLLGLRGMMSEAEVHVLKARMHQGKLNKARRGELFTCVPVGYVRSPDGGIALVPDEQVRSAVSLVFAKFAELGSLTETAAIITTAAGAGRAAGRRTGSRPATPVRRVRGSPATASGRTTTCCCPACGAGRRGCSSTKPAAACCSGRRWPARWAGWPWPVRSGGRASAHFYDDLANSAALRPLV
jgi:DNA invertase Pin-like site-specific DNA recombinase